MPSPKLIFQILRPRHWIKNVFCLAGVFFADQLYNKHSLYLAFMTAVVFCLISSTVYILNDLLDRSRDRVHPFKKFRPIASGKVTGLQAGVMLVLCLVMAFWGSWHLSRSVFFCVGLYFVNNIAYSLWIKQRPILDVLSISFGFILRLFAGVYVINDTPTVWIFLCTFFLTLLLGFSKRRAELFVLEKNGKENLQRASLNFYSIPYLDSLVNAASTMTVISYGLFSTSYGKNPNLILSLPIVYYAIMQYKRKVMVPDPTGRTSEEPEYLATDPDILVPILLWLAVYFVASQGMIALVR